MHLARRKFRKDIQEMRLEKWNYNKNIETEQMAACFQSGCRREEIWTEQWCWTNRSISYGQFLIWIC